MSAWPHEARRCGLAALVLPCAAALVAWAAMATGDDPDGTLLGRALLTTALPAATALACASVVARETMTELHLTLPTRYPHTVARRLCAPTVLAVLAATALVGLLTATGRDIRPATTLTELAGLTALLTGCAVWGTARRGSAGAGTALVIAVCLAKLLLLDRVAPQGAPQGVPALAAGAVLTALALRTLADGDRSGALTPHDKEN
ncbi:hypothetical protein [Streptomyces sp. NPDC049915]|uniref:hypothetical protein n=1 Tax=Streptomyces sp. NPDC049915 TaxID=3155510 RepID=UPI00344675F7